MTSDLDFDGSLTCAMQYSDLDKAVAWYQDILGFTELFRVEEMGWCELQSPVTRVTVGLSEVEAPEVRGGATLTFGVSDVDGAREMLESRDVTFDGETLTIPGMARLATFYDPDGNKLMLVQDLTKQDEQVP
jgi:predicted enzyme related to lactoylglutathione lyase